MDGRGEPWRIFRCGRESFWSLQASPTGVSEAVWLESAWRVVAVLCGAKSLSRGTPARWNQLREQQLPSCPGRVSAFPCLGSEFPLSGCTLGREKPHGALLVPVLMDVDDPARCF